MNSATRVGYNGEEAVLEVKIRLGCELATKFVVLVTMKCVRSVPLPEVDIIVPNPEVTGIPAASLISV